MKTLVLSLLVSMAMLGTVQAHNCPNLAAEVAAKITEMADADADLLATAQELHDAGVALHESGDHDGSVAKLEEALAALTSQ